MFSEFWFAALKQTAVKGQTDSSGFKHVYMCIWILNGRPYERVIFVGHLMPECLFASLWDVYIGCVVLLILTQLTLSPAFHQLFWLCKTMWSCFDKYSIFVDTQKTLVYVAKWVLMPSIAFLTNVGFFVFVFLLIMFLEHKIHVNIIKMNWICIDESYVQA